MKLDNNLVSYIQRENDVAFIDVVKVSKKGTSFFYEDAWWKREPVMRTGYCTNEKGEKLKINPLSRSYDLYSDYNGVIEIKDSAKERYGSWIRGDLKPYK